MKNLKRRGTEIFNLTNTTNEYQIKDDGQLEDLTDAVDFFRKKSEDYEAEGWQKDENNKSSQGQVWTVWKIYR